MPFFFSALFIPTLSSHYHSFDSFFYVEVWCGVKPYLFQLRRIYVVSFRFLSRNYLVTTPILLRYHQISIQYFPHTLPLFSPWRARQVSPRFLFIFIGLTEPVFLFKYLSQSLFTSKICKYTTFFVPLRGKRWRLCSSSATSV